MEQNYTDWVDWEKIDQEEYGTKILAHIKKLDDQRKKLFIKIFDSIKEAGGAEKRVLHVLMEETGDKYKEEMLQILLEYLKKDKKPEQTFSELEFYKKKAQGAEEKSRLLKKEIMGLKVKKRQLEETLEECQRKLLLAEQAGRNYAEQKEILLRIREDVELIEARSKEIKEWPEHFGFVQRKEQQIDDSINVSVIETDKKEIDRNIPIIQNDKKEMSGSVPVTETIPIETKPIQNVSVTEEIPIETEKERKEAEPAEKREETEEAAEAFYEEFRGIALENAIDPEEYGTFMEAVPGEILYYPLEEEDETEEEFEEVGKNQRVNFFNNLLEKMDLNRFQKLKSSEQISKLFELMEDRQISKEEKKIFMRVIQESEEEDYVKIYQYIKEGREKELLKEEWNG